MLVPDNLLHHRMSWSRMDLVKLVLLGLLHFLTMLPEDLQLQLQEYLPLHTQGEQRHLEQGLFVGISSYCVNTDIESVTD
jgi:hypothetical protein